MLFSKYIMKKILFSLLVTLFLVGGLSALEKIIENAKKTKSSPGENIFLTGELIPGGVECRQFKANDGSVYSLEGAGNMFKYFKDGDKVNIKAKLIAASYCMQGNAIQLLEINSIASTTGVDI
jgi:hypothetical protein